jgi:acyl-coenzyme A synthetase/AMP-(fatty) acid ligase
LLVHSALSNRSSSFLFSHAATCHCESARIRKNLTHERLRQFIVEEFDLGTYGMSPDDVCAICMPNGAEAAVTLLATMCYCTAVPLSAQETSEELRKALKRTEAQLVIVMKGCDNDPVTTAASELGLSVVEFASHPYVIGLTTANGIISGRIRKQKERVASSPNNIALMLHTSGTSGNQKLVPYTVSTIVVGSACIAKAWDLGPGDVGLNMMPLFHVGGIMRNLVGPILSGSAMVCCATFDSELFWTVARSYGVTWYYGSPTMHHMVLQAGKTVEDVKPLRFIANAAGGLLPSMAEELREKFKACVLPSCKYHLCIRF